MNGTNTPRKLHFTIAQDIFHKVHASTSWSRSLGSHLLQQQAQADTDPLTDIESAYGIVIKRLFR
eukprot:758159-Hanusia_phi.AAC.1